MNSRYYPLEKSKFLQNDYQFLSTTPVRFKRESARNEESHSSLWKILNIFSGARPSSSAHNEQREGESPARYEDAHCDCGETEGG